VTQIKSHSTVESIAKKHRLDVSFVQNQLKMGVQIEHEHTKDKDLATDIALQHLDEIPDYYTRLKKMEKSAIKNHKKFKDVNEEKMGLWDNIHAKRARGERPAKKGEKGYPKTLKIDEGIKQARKNVGASKCWSGKKLGTPRTKIKNGKEVPNCVPVAESNGVRYCPKCNKNETRNECKYGERVWDMFSQPIRLGNKYTPNTPHPGNMPEAVDHEHSMARSELYTISSAVKRLRKKMKGEGNIEAWVQSKITKAADYLDSAADYVDSGEMKENVERGPVLPNAPGLKGEKGKRIYPKDQEPKPTGAKLFPLAKNKSRKLDVAHYDPDGNYIGEDAEQEKFDRKQAASIHPSKLKTFEQFVLEAKTAAWQRKEGKRESGGLNKAGVESYRKENPGSKLKTAVTKDPSKLKKGEKAWNRRKSFCSRMTGMKKKLTSAKTARDPNSRINKSLRSWNC
jgi:hypothetical protein